MLLPILLAFLQSSAWGPAVPPASVPHVQDGCSGISMGPGGPRVLRWAGCESRYWDVVCPMSSDTCSDGRKITTVRASSVPCEVSPGVWEMVPENTACISYRGLESWAQTTTYLSHGAALGESPWVASSSGASLEPLPDGWRIHKPEGGLFGWRQNVSGMADDTYTSTCIVRGSAPGTRLYVSMGTFCTVDIDSEDWTQVSCTRLASASHFLGVYPCGNTDPECSLDVKACWYTQSEFSGRPCWGGEAPVTCAADRHTISTDGWPTEEGEISLVYEPAHGWGGERILLADGTRFQAKVVGTTHLRVFLNGTGTNVPVGSALRLGRNHFRFRLVPGEGFQAVVNGEVLSSVPTDPIAYSDTISIGTTGPLHADGSISSLRWRSK